MKGIITILFAFLVIGSNAQNKLGPIGQWRAHFDNHSIEHIVKGGDYVYAASPYQIISIDSRKNNYWIDKTNGLSDINFNQLAWDEIQQQLVIVYANSNIDILKGDQIFNVNALQLTNLYPDKKINTIRIYKQWAILATNFGIVIIDLIKHEVKDNWFPNNNQQPIATLDVLIANDSVYATTSNGLWASAFNANTLQPNQWNRLTGYDRYTLKKLTQYNGNIYGYNNHSFFQLPQTNPFLQFTNATINHVDTSATNLYIGIQYPNQKGALLQLNKDKSVSILIDSSLLGVPKQSVVENNNFWVADSVKGLLLKNNTVQWMPLGGPNARIQGMEAISENELIAPYGALTKGFAKFNESGWTSYQQLGAVQLPNLNASTINNKERSYWFTTNSSIFYISNDNKAENIQDNKESEILNNNKLNSKKVLLFPDTRQAKKNIPSSLINKLENEIATKGYTLEIAYFKQVPDITTNNKNASNNKVVYANFKTLIQLIMNAELILGADSLPIHLAYLLKKPHYILYPNGYPQLFMTPYAQINNRFGTFDHYNFSFL